MEKKNTKTQQKTASLGLKTETLRRLDDSQMKAVVAGGFKIRTPVGFDDNTTPIYDDTDG